MPVMKRVNLYGQGRCHSVSHRALAYRELFGTSLGDLDLCERFRVWSVCGRRDKSVDDRTFAR